MHRTHNMTDTITALSWPLTCASTLSQRGIQSLALSLAWLGIVLFSSAAQAATIEVLVQDANGKSLSDAVAFLESPAAKRALAGQKALATMDMSQMGKQFDPKILVVPVGTMVRFPNLDSVRHHVYSFSPAKTFDLKLYSGTPANPVQFDKTGIAVLGCNIHDNMVAWVVVVDTPYYAKSAKSGQLVLRDVPPGSYSLRVWHAGMPPGSNALERALTVEATDAVVTVRATGSAQ